MKNKIMILMGLAVLVAAVFAVAQSTDNTLSGTTTAADPDIYPQMLTDQSDYANYFSRHGTIVRRFSAVGTTTTNGQINLGAALPEGAIITRVFRKIDEAFLPATGTTNVLGHTQDDNSLIVSAVTPAVGGVTGAIINDANPNGIHITNATTYLTVDWSGTLTSGDAVTQGVFTVIAEYLLSNPNE